MLLVGASLICILYDCKKTYSVTVAKGVSSKSAAAYIPHTLPVLRDQRHEPHPDYISQTPAVCPRAPRATKDSKICTSSAVAASDLWLHSGDPERNHKPALGDQQSATKNTAAGCELQILCSVCDSGHCASAARGWSIELLLMRGSLSPVLLIVVLQIIFLHRYSNVLMFVC